MARYLVVYYSWTGYTRRMATAVAQRLDADIEQIRDVEPRGVLGHVAFGVEAALGARGLVLPSSTSPADYDLVVVCTPVWALNVPPPVRAWLERERTGIRQLALLCTQFIIAGDRCLEHAAAICGRAPVARAVISDAKILMDSWQPLVDAFVDEIQAAAPGVASADTPSSGTSSPNSSSRVPWTLTAPPTPRPRAAPGRGEPRR